MNEGVIVSIIVTSPVVVLIMQFISIVGYFFLFAFTLISYKKLHNRTLLFISLAFLVITISVILEVVLPLYEEMFPIEESYIEASFESIQFIAAFFFFYGLRIIKKKKEGN